MDTLEIDSSTRERILHLVVEEGPSPCSSSRATCS